MYICWVDRYDLFTNTACLFRFFLKTLILYIIDAAKWMKKYEDLSAYVNTFGNCAVPRKFDFRLFGFVNCQRRDFRKRIQSISDGKKQGMTDKRISLLKKINFDFKC